MAVWENAAQGGCVGLSLSLYPVSKSKPVEGSLLQIGVISACAKVGSEDGKQNVTRILVS